MFKLIFAFLLLVSTAKADFVGFSSGFEFQATPVEGTVIITCEGFNGNAQATYTCRDAVLEPMDADNFMGPRDARAKQVELRALREDGSTRVKTASYDGANGKTSSPINLWQSTIFQQPLLSSGLNQIHFSIYSSNNDSTQEVAKGDFTVNVKRGALRRCPTTQYQSTDVTDCNSQYSICQRYFEQYNNCRQ